MIPVGKALRLCKLSFKMVLIKANTKKRKGIVKSDIPLDAGSTELCIINGSPIHVQHTVQTCPWKALLHFGHSSYYNAF